MSLENLVVALVAVILTVFVSRVASRDTARLLHQWERRKEPDEPPELPEPKAPKRKRLPRGRRT